MMPSTESPSIVTPSASLFRPLLPAFVSVADMHPDLADPAWLHPAERACIAGAVDKRQREFAAGRLLARALLASEDNNAFALLSDGDRVPQWPGAVVGSITHCRSLCSVAVAARDMCGGIGLDVEPSQPLKPDLLRMILRDAEFERLAGFPTAVRALGGILTFSAKEAVYKAIFPLRRVFLEFREVEVDWSHDDDPTDGTEDLCGRFEAEVKVPAATVPGLRRIVGRYRVADGHVATAVVLPP